MEAAEQSIQFSLKKYNSLSLWPLQYLIVIDHVKISIHLVSYLVHKQLYTFSILLSTQTALYIWYLIQYTNSFIHLVSYSVHKQLYTFGILFSTQTALYIQYLTQYTNSFLHLVSYLVHRQLQFSTNQIFPFSSLDFLYLTNLLPFHSNYLRRQVGRQLRDNRFFPLAIIFVFVF